MNSELDALRLLHSSAVSSSSDSLIPCAQFAEDSISSIIETGKNGTQPQAVTGQSTVQQSSTESNNHYFDTDGSRYLIIANVSKKPNMKTLIYSAAAHGFSVIIVGLPNLDVNDLHLAEGVVGAVDNTSSSREKWRNMKASNILDCSNHDMRKHSNCNPELSEKTSGAKIDGDDDKNDKNCIETENNSSAASTTNSKGNHDSVEESTSSSSNKKLPFCSILRFETLLELKSFLVKREITLMGIEIMDEGY